MRPVEILLSLANLLTFFLLVALLPRAVPWMRYLAATMLLIAITQVLVEGARWQMAPAYVLTFLFFLALLLKNIPSASQPAKQKRIHKVVFGLATCLGVLGLAASIALPILLPVFHFPQPGGPYEIGTITCDWTPRNL